MIAHIPPFFCASAIICVAIVVLPEDSGPYISTTLPSNVIASSFINFFLKYIYIHDIHNIYSILTVLTLE